MTWLKELKKGDEVYLVTSSRYETNRKVEVQAVGRKWITLSGNRGRVAINQELRNNSAIIDQNFGSPDLVFPNAEAYEKHVKAVKLRKAVKEAVVYGGLTDEQIADIAKLIGLNPPEAS